MAVPRAPGSERAQLVKNTGEHDKRLHQPGAEVCRKRWVMRCMRAHFLRFIQVNKLDDDCAKAAACKSTFTGLRADTMTGGPIYSPCRFYNGTPRRCRQDQESSIQPCSGCSAGRRFTVSLGTPAVGISIWLRVFTCPCRRRSLMLTSLTLP